MNQLTDPIEILHRNSICVTTEPPTASPGTPVALSGHSVVCGDCGRAGTLAIEGREDQVREEWAAMNGFLVIRGTDGEYTVGLR